MADLHTKTADAGDSAASSAATRRRARQPHGVSVGEFALANGSADISALEAEVAALAAQLQDARERQKTLSATLENVLNSTGIATVVLDAENRIRFFTPATRGLFNMLPGDIGRPVFDLASHTPDPMLADDIATVSHGGACEDRQLRSSDGIWFNRRVQPFRTHDNRISGVVITYLDVTDRKNGEQAIAQARAAADAAAQASARFLSAASHDLRQPLQTMMLLQELLASKAHDPELQRLIGRLDLTLEAMASLLDGLLDRSRMEAGAVDIAISSFALDDLFAEVVQDVAALAETARLKLRHVPTRLVVRSDRRLMGAMIRNLVTSALKNTVKGGVLIGARRRGNSVRIDVWDSGTGIPADQQAAILGSGPHDGGNAVNLGLAMVRNMAAMLDHPIGLSSRTGDRHGTMFSITVPLEAEAVPKASSAEEPVPTPAVSARILVIDDDAEVLAVMTELLRSHGHNVVTARDEDAALATLATTTPDLIIADYRLLDRDGLELVDDLRARLLALHQRRVPAILLTGDTSADVATRLADRDVQRLSKPVRQAELVSAITTALEQAGLPLSAPDAKAGDDDAAAGTSNDIVHIIDDDPDVRDQLGLLLADAGLNVQLHASSAAFRANWQPGTDGCLLIDAMMPGETGLDLLRSLKSAGTLPPAIMITGQGDVAMAVAAMKAGAVDFIEKPASSAVIIASIKRALASRNRKAGDGISEERRAAAAAAAARLVSLTPRQREVMAMVLDGHPSKNIAADLKLSQRTVENHRAEIMHRSGCKSLPELARLVM
ncbi:MAG: hypothetical protein RIS17_1140, partial [Pseudomonadota bacterium]